MNLIYIILAPVKKKSPQVCLDNNAKHDRNNWQSILYQETSKFSLGLTKVDLLVEI